jgi:Tfp pilus assembly protein PilW
MNKSRDRFNATSHGFQPLLKEGGFSLVEFLVSVVILMVLSAGIFTMLSDAQGTSGYQSQVLNVMENNRLAMNILGRYIVQAGNNPKAAAFAPVTINSSTEVRLRADVTGSAGGNQGDSDGDVSDSDEDITIRYNSNARTIELVDAGGTVRILAESISGFSMQYLDANGNTTSVGANVRSIGVTITGASSVANARTGKTYGQTLTGVFYLQNLG